MQPSEKDFSKNVRLDRAIRERMDRSKRETGGMRKFHDQVKRSIDEDAKRLDK
jgi:hypothetical protein